MGRSPCCEKVGLKKGPWTPEEDQKLLAYIEDHGHGSWRALPAKAGLQRCGKSCRLRWTNYLRPDIKRGKFSLQEEQTIIQLHALLGNRWSAIATHLSKRTDNEIKNYWNTHLKKRLAKMGIDPVTHKPKTNALTTAEGHTKSAANLSHMAQWESARLEAEARLVRESKLRSTTTANTPTSSSSFPAPATPCLDVFRAWQGIWSKPTRDGQSHSQGQVGIDLESPTSTLTFSDTNNPDEPVDWKSFSKPIPDGFPFEQPPIFNSGGCGGGGGVGGDNTWLLQESAKHGGGYSSNANFGDGFTGMLMGKYSDEQTSSSEGNRADDDSCNEVENKSYWDSIFNLVNSTNVSTSLFSSLD